jgi:hypothetical protein
VLNSVFDNSGNHIAYMQKVAHAIVTKNTFSRPAFGRTAFRVTGGPEGDFAVNLHFIDNNFLGWVDPLTEGGAGRGGGSHNGGGTRYNYALVNFSPGAAEESCIETLVFEHNAVTNFEIGVVHDNGQNGRFLNNIFETPIAGTCLYLNYQSVGGGSGALCFRPLSRTLIAGNTIISGGYTASELQTNPMIQASSYNPNHSQKWGTLDKGVRIVGNIFATYSDGASVAAQQWTSAIPGFSSDNNLYWMPTKSGNVQFQIGSTNKTLAQWRAETGSDAASAVGNPQFVAPLAKLNNGAPGVPSSSSAAIAEVTSLAASLPIGSTSPAIALGLNIGAPVYRDFAGTVRPVDAQNKIAAGAFAYVSGSLSAHASFSKVAATATVSTSVTNAATAALKKLVPSATITIDGQQAAQVGATAAVKPAAATGAIGLAASVASSAAVKPLVASGSVAFTAPPASELAATAGLKSITPSGTVGLAAHAAATAALKKVTPSATVVLGPHIEISATAHFAAVTVTGGTSSSVAVAAQVELKPVAAHGALTIEQHFKNAKMRLRVISPTPIPYGSSPEIQLDVEHPVQLVKFGVEVFKDGASIEYVFVFGESSAVERLAVPAIAGGESYLFTVPEVRDGYWEFEARTDYGVCTEVIRETVQPPENSLLF